jgi:hypothetical protein
MQETSGTKRKDMTITNNTPGEALLTCGCSTEDYQIRSGNWNTCVKANEKKKIRKQKIVQCVNAPLDCCLLNCTRLNVSGVCFLLKGHYLPKS